MHEKLSTGGIGPNLLPYSNVLRECLRFVDQSSIQYPSDVENSLEARWKYLCTHQEAMKSYATHVDTLIRIGKISIEGTSVDDAHVVQGESGALLHKGNLRDAQLGPCRMPVDAIRKLLKSVVEQQSSSGVVWEASPTLGKYNSVRLVPLNDERSRWTFLLEVNKPGAYQQLPLILQNVSEDALARAFTSSSPWKDKVPSGWDVTGDGSKVPGATFRATRTISFDDREGVLKTITWNVKHTNPSTPCPSSMSSWFGHKIDDTLELT